MDTRVPRTARIRDRQEKYQYDLNRCYMHYFDLNNNSANYTPPETTAPPELTTIISHQITGSDILSKYLIYIIAAVVAFVIVAFFVICCCIRQCTTAKKERRKRKEIEGEYKIVASTLTNITDSEDGCAYETLSMRDPTYNGGVQLPTRKQQKGKIKGVSNPFSVMKRLLSEDGESTGSTDTTITYTSDNKRSQPLPAIPEAYNNKDNVKAIDEYTDIGSESIRRKNEYHHLNSSTKDSFYDGNPYDTLSESHLLSTGVKENKTDDYFILEKAKSDNGKDIENPQRQSGGYFLLEKVNRVGSEKGLCKSSSQGVIIPSESVRALENSLTAKYSDQNVANEARTVNQRLVSDDSDLTDSITNNQGSENQNRASNAYFTLSKESDSNKVEPTPPQNEYLDLEQPAGISNRTSYLEPSEIQRHSYVDVVADFSQGKSKKGGTIPAYAVVKK
ncbi:uncharacterized protein LOC133187905 isoform X2 [Saccostrea echinata]|uniref:uncharacterized protein LOC133187905 isoform X2 n=1 Tax=Saccostrea echinata TaxID=191078 RepID=UPI002A835353|nr:uncharacterized protein LOC133187905 isoform X2 [Saccostrea echinata]